jgi:hypothetical protein
VAERLGIFDLERGAKVAGAAFLIEIEPLGGRERLAPHRVEATLIY